MNKRQKKEIGKEGKDARTRDEKEEEAEGKKKL